MISKKIQILVVVMVTLFAFSLSAFDQGVDQEVKLTKVPRVPVYYMGHQSVMEKVDKLAEQSLPIRSLANIPFQHILIIDKSYAVSQESNEQEFIKKEIEAGVPVISIGDTSVIKGFFEKDDFHPGIAEGMSPDGRPTVETGYGYMIVNEPGYTFTKVFITSEEDPAKAAQQAYQWAAQNMMPNADDWEDISLRDDIAQTAASPYWSSVYQLDYTTGTNWQPYGKMNVRTIYYKMYDDNSSTYDWYDIRCKHQSVPGISLDESGYENYCTSEMFTWIDADYYTSSYFLSDYGPTSTSGSSSVGVNVGVTAGTDGASVSSGLSWSYTVSDVVVSDNSDFSIEKASWDHDVNQSKTVGKNTYLAEPGACVRVYNGGSREWREHYGIIFAKQIIFWFYTSEGWVEFHI